MSIYEFMKQSYKKRAGEIYNTYIKDKLELNEENVDNAIKQYERANHYGFSRKVLLKKYILTQDFHVEEWYLNREQNRECIRIREAKNQKDLQRAHEKYLKTTDKIIDDLKEEILEDKRFCAKLGVYTQTLKLQKKKRYLKRLLEKENRQDDTFDAFEEIEPNNFLNFKEEMFQRIFDAYKERNNPKLYDGWDSRIKKEILRFMKTID